MTRLRARCSGWSAEVRCSAAPSCKGLHLTRQTRPLIQTYPNLSGDDWRWSEMGWEILGTWFTNSCVILCLSCLSLNVWKSLDPRHQPIRSNMQSYIYTKLRSYILRLRSLRELICSLDKHGKVMQSWMPIKSMHWRFLVLFKSLHPCNCQANVACSKHGSDVADCMQRESNIQLNYDTRQRQKVQSADGPWTRGMVMIQNQNTANSQ